MNNKVKIKILKIISNSGNITELIKDGYTYGQIADMVNLLLDKGYLNETEEESVIVTKTGHKWLENIYDENKLKGSAKWILEEEKSKIKQLGKNEVYLPNKDELNF